MTDNAEKDRPLHRLSDDDLSGMAQGCTELTCLYHGVINAERQRRARVIPPGTGDTDA